LIISKFFINFLFILRYLFISNFANIERSSFFRLLILLLNVLILIRLLLKIFFEYLIIWNSSIMLRVFDFLLFFRIFNSTIRTTYVFIIIILTWLIWCLLSLGSRHIIIFDIVIIVAYFMNHFLRLIISVYTSLIAR
jgi:hypothetical protein